VQWFCAPVETAELAVRGPQHCRQKGCWDVLFWRKNTAVKCLQFTVKQGGVSLMGWIAQQPGTAGSQPETVSGQMKPGQLSQWRKKRRASNPWAGE